MPDNSAGVYHVKAKHFVLTSIRRNLWTMHRIESFHNEIVGYLEVNIKERQEYAHLKHIVEVGHGSHNPTMELVR